MARRRAANHDAPFLGCGCERSLPGRFADRLDDHVRANASRRVLHGLHDVRVRMVDGEVGAECTRLSSFSSLDDVTIVRAPSARAISKAASATPRRYPQMSTQSSSRSDALVTSMRYAVSNTSGNAAPSSNESASSSG